MAGVGRCAHSPAFTGLPTYLEPVLLPEPMHTLDVQTPALLNQQRRNPTIPEPGPAKSQTMHVRNQLPLIRMHTAPVALAAARLTDRAADSTLGIPQPLVKMLHAPATAGWGQEFFES